MSPSPRKRVKLRDSHSAAGDREVSCWKRSWDQPDHREWSQTYHVIAWISLNWVFLELILIWTWAHQLKNPLPILMMAFLEIKNPVHNMQYCFHWLIPFTVKNVFIFYIPLISGFNFETLSFVVSSSAMLWSNLHFPWVRFLARGSAFFLLRKLDWVLELLQRKNLFQFQSFGYFFPICNHSSSVKSSLESWTELIHFSTITMFICCTRSCTYMVLPRLAVHASVTVSHWPQLRA